MKEEKKCLNDYGIRRKDFFLDQKTSEFDIITKNGKTLEIINYIC